MATHSSCWLLASAGLFACIEPEPRSAQPAWWYVSPVEATAYNPRWPPSVLVPAAPVTQPTPAPAPTATATASTPSGNDKPPEVDRCSSEAGTREDCRNALEKLAARPGPLPVANVRDTYKRGCEKKAPFLGCGIFKSTAVSESDNPVIELLMACEHGRTTACEGLTTKPAPLQAWLSTLKTTWCSKGETALCKDFKDCKIGNWACEVPTSSPQEQAKMRVCGCSPKKCSGTVNVTETGLTWPDGSLRGKFSCVQSAK